MTVNLCRGHADVADLAGVLDRYRPDDGGEGHGLVSSLPMTVDRLALPGRSGLHGEVRASWGRVSVIAVHLLNPVDAWLARAPFRRRQVAALCDLLDADPTDRILLGDLNATPRWPAYRQLTRRLDDTVAQWGSEHRVPTPCTWARRPGSPGRLRIDHVLAAGLGARHVEAVPVKGSDHRALLVDLAPTTSDLPGERDRAA